MELYQIKNLTVTYHHQKEATLKNIELTIKKGSITLVCGKNGCGKSTLLKQLKSGMFTSGNVSGTIFFEGKCINEIDQVKQCEMIAYLNQNIEEQIIHDKVSSEMAFSLEALGYDSITIHKKVMEMASYFGLESLLHKDCATLSGGWKQCLNLASLMVLQPKVLLLDEPFSQLDPIACDKLLSMLMKIKNEFQTTMIIVEQRLDLLLPFCEDIVYMEQGKILKHDEKNQVIHWMLEHDKDTLLPDYLKLTKLYPLNNHTYDLKAIKNSFHQYYQENPIKDQIRSRESSNEVILECSKVSFAYDQKIILKEFDMKVCKNDVVGILGANGSGKSTLLKLILKKYKYLGKIKDQNLSYMYVPQDIRLLFTKDCLYDEFYDCYDHEQIEYVLSLFQVQSLIKKHPYDLSLGELHKMAICKMILENKDCYLLDEITKGLDEESKQLLIDVIKQLKKEKTFIIVSHDLEFIAKVCNKAGLLFEGTLQSLQECYQFFTNNLFYTTMISKVVKDDLPHVMILEDLKQQTERIQIPKIKTEVKHKEKKHSWKLFLSLLIMILFMIVLNSNRIKQVVLSLPVMIMILMIFMIYFGFKLIHYSFQKHDILFGCFYFIICPLTLGLFLYFDIQNYLLMSLVLLSEMMLPLLIYYKHSKLSSSQFVLLACLCALAIASRVMLMFFPQVKVIASLCIITSLVFHKEFGFMMAAISMLGSNMLFSQGIWTPFQMVAMGMVAYFVEIVIHKNNKLERSIYAFFAIVFLYGMTMNFSSLLYTKATLNLSTFLVYEFSGLPLDLIHGFVNALFLYYFGDEIINKLQRYQKLYM